MKNNQTINFRKCIGLILCTFFFLSVAYSQKSIKGKVVDMDGEALPGVSIVLRETTTGTYTDAEGNYKIIVQDENSVLEFSFLGFKTILETVGVRAEIDVVMQESQTKLDEVIVVGYGTQKRVHMTGSVAQITSKELLQAPMQNVSNMLTGKISGLTSLQRSGKPGEDGTTLYVRGLNSFSGNGPLIIVDGVPRQINYLNPNDIESVSVLKDAAAAIYGVQGANGVILITTKAGSEGPAKISYDGSYTITENTAMPELLNARDYMYWHNKAREMDGLTPVWTADIQNRVMNNDPNSIWGQTDWLDKIFRSGRTQQHNISATGGKDKVRYFTSIGYMDQEGTLRNTEFKRYNIRTNLDIQVVKNLRFLTNLSAYRTDRDWPGSDVNNQAEFNPVKQAIIALPIIKSEFKGMPAAWHNGTYLMNGYAALNESGYKQKISWNFDSNFKLEYDFSELTNLLKGLKISLFAAYNYSNVTDSNYDRYYELHYVNMNLDEGVSGASGYTKGGAYSKSASWGDYWLLRPQVNYSREFNKHYVAATFLYEAQRSYSSTMTGVKKGFFSDDPVDISLGTTFTEIPVTGSHKYMGGLASYVGRFNYAFDKKYLVEFAFRRDGSYIFAPETRWGFFPSASLGWLISKENFFKSLFPSVDLLRIRTSYGQSGNSNVSPYLFNSKYKLAANSMILGTTPITQFYSDNAYIYRNLTWARTHSYNIGFDLEVWNKKLGVELDLFYKFTEDILESQSGNYPPSLGGYYPIYQNSGKVENKGLEVTLKHSNRINTNWSYSLRGNFSFARNRVLSKVVTDSYPNYRAILGEPMNARYGFQALGLFKNQEEIDNYPAAPSGNIRPGDIKYLDVNGDGIISSQYDYVKIGYGDIPEINFSLNVDVNYKNFYLTMLWQGVTHCDYELSGIYNTGVTSSTVYTSVFGENGNSPYYRVEGAWTPENPNAKYPRLTTVNSGNNAWRSTWWVVNGEYLRLKNLNIGYNIPEKVLRKTPFSRIHLFVSGTNLLTFSHFKYVDPESPSVSNGYYPQQKTYSMGLNLTF